ncbi:hypothetical protein JCGZ_09745 [Jatropha curcas]|uniref:Uncharacterized protein n=1 Tax=Jatropha curcas TaxID=180498 RepID=A0A067LAJ8_JATCU|nr:uncharacterized protein LOC105642775 [Jatropha curcas]XP_012083115.1 uncharacterized protein LOC105642775 [Jatropha curcas]KDP45496.1 hypothetical protein JCGZ_09745 [Jatropha curcas]
MTANSIQETQDRVSDFEIQQKSKDFLLPNIAMESDDLAGKMGVKVFTESEMDRESGGSSEDVEDSPKSVGKWRNMEKLGFVHSQVLKIREEDSHLGEDFVEGLSAKDKVINGGFGQNIQFRRVASAVDVVFFTRPVLPCSPLGGKTAVEASP